MGLAEALIETEQSERGGEIAQRGFDFQSCWAISHILEYELKGQEYVFLFEYHDDVVVLDSEIAPQKAIFIQVKTKEKSWNLSDLINAKKNKPISFIGKLFKHKYNFKGLKTELSFVTNAYFNFDSRNVFVADEISSKNQDLISSKVSEQLNIVDPINLADLTFITSDLSLEGHLTHLKGKICDFFDQYFEAGHHLNASSFAKSLENTCREKAKVRSTDIKSFSELVLKKGISSKFMKSTLSRLNLSKQLEPDWNTAERLFSNYGKSNIQLISLRANFVRISISIKKPDSIDYIYFNSANELFDKYKVEGCLKSFITEIVAKLSLSLNEYSEALTDNAKECIIVYSIIKNILEDERI